MVSVTCYGGANEIGGNQILVEDKDVKFFFDFGTPFARWNRYFEEFLRPRAGAGLLDPLIMGLLPAIRGIYREDLEYPQDIWDQLKSRYEVKDLTGANIAGILLSHAHLDHCGYISFLKEDIPIYSSAATAFIAKVIQDTAGGSEFEKEVCYFNPRQLSQGYLASSKGNRCQRKFQIVDIDNLPEKAQSFWNSRCVSRGGICQWETMEQLQLVRFRPKSIGGLPLSSFPVDHSIPGALAYAVETSAGWIVYTGDIRKHGLESEKTKQFIENVKKLKVKLLICEGTRVNDIKNISEEEVHSNCLRAVKNAKGKLVIADFGPRNIERIRIFLEIAKVTDRKLVILAKDAYLLRWLSYVSPEVSLSDWIRHMVLYQERKDPNNLKAWERDIRNWLSPDKSVNPSDINRYPANFILCFSFWDIKHLIDINITDGLYIYSASEVHSEDQAIDIRRLHNWLDAFNFQRIGLPAEVQKGKWEVPEDQLGFHASGHASGNDILDMIREIGPKVLIPVHTENPQFFAEKLKGTGIEVRIPKQGQPEIIT